MRGFKCVPVSLIYSAVMAGLTSFERDVVYSAQLGQDERHCLPYDEATLRSIIFPTRGFVAPKEIANAREKLLALGVFVRKHTARKEWLEIAPDFRHQQGNNETSFGDHEAEPEQIGMTMEQELFALPSPQPPKRLLLPPRQGKGESNNRPRVEQEEKQSSSNARGKSEAADNDNDKLSLEELESRLKAAGGNLTTEDRKWRVRSEKQGWSLDDKGWRRWLIIALERKPRTVRFAQPAAMPASTMPADWPEFVRERYAQTTLPAADSWKGAQTVPNVLREFAEWQKARRVA